MLITQHGYEIQVKKVIFLNIAFIKIIKIT